MSYPKPPPHLVSLADDNRLGIWNRFGWGEPLDLPPVLEWPMMVTGLVLLIFCIRALLRPELGYKKGIDETGCCGKHTCSWLCRTSVNRYPCYVLPMRKFWNSPIYRYVQKYTISGH